MFKRYQGDWDDRGSVTPIQAMFNVCRGAYVTDGAGAPVVRVGKDQIEIFREDVVQCRFDRANKPDEPVLFWMLPGTYHVVLEDPEVASLRVKLAQRDQFLTLETEAREAELTVSDAEEKNCALVCEAEKPYEIRMVSSLEHAYKEVSLTGVTGQIMTAAGSRRVAPIETVEYFLQIRGGNTDAVVSNAAADSSIRQFFEFYVDIAVFPAVFIGVINEILQSPFQEQAVSGYEDFVFNVLRHGDAVCLREGKILCRIIDYLSQVSFFEGVILRCERHPCIIQH